MKELLQGELHMRAQDITADCMQMNYEVRQLTPSPSLASDTVLYLSMAPRNSEQTCLCLCQGGPVLQSALGPMTAFALLLKPALLALGKYMQDLSLVIS